MFYYLIRNKNNKKHSNDECNELIISKHRSFAFISLSIGFLVIWTAVIAGVLISNTLSDNVAAKDTVRIFRIQEEYAKIIYALGHEMVSNVNYLLRVEDDLKEKRRSLLESTWRDTEVLLDSIQHSQIDQSVQTLATNIRFRLTDYRQRLVPGFSLVEIIDFYSQLAEVIQRKSFLLNSYTINGVVRRNLPLPSTAYALFIEGMFKKLTFLALQNIYIWTDHPVNKSQLINTYHGSQLLIENAFQLNPRARVRFLDLEEYQSDDKGIYSTLEKDIFTGTKHRKDKQFLTDLDKSTSLELDRLVALKNLIHTSFSSQLGQLANNKHKVLAFHLSIAVIAFIAVVVCLSLYCFSFRYYGSTHYNDAYYNGQTYVYKVDPNDDKSQMLRSY